MISTNDLIKKYGQPSPTGEKYLTTITLPYKMRLAWDTHAQVSTINCHKLVADKLTAIFKDILDHYGYEKIVELGIDLYGGCFNFRKMRNGDEWSRHSWGVAIDLDPARNTLKESKRTARFAKPEYKPMIDIFYKHGFVSLGVEKDYDWMHFEIKE